MRYRLARLLGAIVISAALLAAGLSGSAAARGSEALTGPAKSTTGPRADFNGDGFGDLAVGVPGEDFGSRSNPGGVNVLYGTSSGLAAAGNQFWSQSSPGIKGTAEDNDSFGWAVAVGDFNHDGFTDLAVGVPGEGVNGVSRSGAVNVIYGSASGLTAAGNQVWDQSSKGVPGDADVDDQFGFALATRDFNGDGYSDLAVGVPGEAGAHGSADVGAVNIFYGSSAGLTASGASLIRGRQDGERFGSALAAGDFNADGIQDLAVGAPDATDSGKEGAGDAYWMDGSSSGLSQPEVVPDTSPMAGARCGSSLTSFNWDNDSQGYAELAAGCPHDSSGPRTDVGTVDLHDGGPGGPLDPVGVFDGPSPQSGEEFGTSLAAGDAGNDQAGGGEDLFVGAPLYDVGTAVDAGMVAVVYNHHGGVYQELMQGLNETMGTPENADLFGSSLACGNFDGDGFADIAVGVPGEGLGSTGGAGGINVLYGSSAGITSAGNQFWSQNSAGIVGTAENEDFFGSAVSARNG